jgi:hypothetical protein
VAIDSRRVSKNKGGCGFIDQVAPLATSDRTTLQAATYVNWMNTIQKLVADDAGPNRCQEQLRIFRGTAAFRLTCLVCNDAQSLRDDVHLTGVMPGNGRTRQMA